MDRDYFMRRVLWVTAVFNLGGALIFLFPSSLGQLAGLPVPVPPIYSSLLALFVVLFGGAYAWLARQPIIDRPLVALAAFGKAGFFAVMLVFWLLGEGPGRGVAGAAGDLVFAIIFARWLMAGASRTAAADPLASASLGQAGG